jgi:hypothetical protein
LITGVNSFFDFILTSSLIDLLSEYSVPGQTIGHGSRAGTVTITASEPGSGSGQISDAQIQQALQDWTTHGTPNGSIPQPTSNTLYFIYLPPGVTSTLEGFQSCQAGGYCGYHGDINGNIIYAVEPFLPCAGCTFGDGQALDSLTKVSSHELCEAITNPASGGWWDDDLAAQNQPPEIGDICNTTEQQIGGFTIQAEWSNQGNACLIQPSVPKPMVTGLNPASGSTAGGDSVAISGSGFTGASAVNFGAAAATFSADSDTQITATSPAVADAGAVDVTVTTPAGTSPTSTADQFTYS